MQSSIARTARSARVLSCLISAATLVAGTASATPIDIQVQLTNCTEFVGVAPVDPARARALVPDHLTVQRLWLGPTAGASMVVRVMDCAGIGVDGEPAQPARVAHIGINIIAPLAGAYIDNYTISYASNHSRLVSRLRSMGVPAEFDRNIHYEWTPATSPVPPGAGEVYAAVTPPGSASVNWVAHGTMGASIGAPAPFIAHWWYAGRGQGQGQPENKLVKMATNIPLIEFFDGSAVSFLTARSNVIGNLIGANRIGTFTDLAVRGAFANATMVVTRQP